MFYQSITIEGFGPYEKATTVEFTSGVNVISGRNESGKTTIIDAIHWALFGKIATAGAQFNRTSVVNNYSARARVVLKFVSQNFGEVTISRSLTKADKPKHDLRVEVDGEEIITGVKKGQYKIIELLSGLESDSFSASSMLVSSTEKGVNDFISGNSTKRREILRDVADPMKVMESRNKEVRAEIREVKSQLDKATGEKELIENMISELDVKEKPEGDIEELTSLKDDAVVRLNHLMSHSSSTSSVIITSRIKDKIADNKNLISRYTAELNESISDVEKLRAEMNEAVEKEEEDKEKADKIERRLEYLGEEKEAGLYIKKTREERAEEISRLLSFINLQYDDARVIMDLRAKSSTTCVICGSDTSDKQLLDHDEFSHLNSDRDKLLEEEKENNSIIKSLSQRVSDIDEMRVRLNTSLSSIKRSSSYIPSISRDIAKKTSRIQELRELVNTTLPKKIASLEEELAKYHADDSDVDNSSEIESLEKTRNYFDDLISNYNQQLIHYNDYVAKSKDYNSKLEDATDRFEELKKVLERLEQERFETSDKGKISEDIAKIMASVSHSASQAFTTIFPDDKPLDIVLVSSVEDGSGDTCIITANSNDLSSFAHSKQLKIAVCIMLGLTKSVSEHLSEWFPPLWDEPTIAMDDNFARQFHKGFPAFIQGDGEQAIVITRDDIDYVGEANIIYPDNL